MSGEDTPRVPVSLRDQLLALIGDPTIPPHWRGRAIGLYGDLTAPDPSPDAVARGRDLVDAAELYHRVWALHCRVEGVVFGARSEPEDLSWRADAVELLDQWARGGTQ
ncbi:MAG: hypothetical protein R3F65_32330 [bacterium]